MVNCNLSKAEQVRRKEIVEHTRYMILEQMPVDDQDETSLMLGYKGYYLQIRAIEKGTDNGDIPIGSF